MPVCVATDLTEILFCIADSILPGFGMVFIGLLLLLLFALAFVYFRVGLTAGIILSVVLVFGFAGTFGGLFNNLYILLLIAGGALVGLAILYLIRQ